MSRMKSGLKKDCGSWPRRTGLPLARDPMVSLYAEPLGGGDVSRCVHPASGIIPISMQPGFCSAPMPIVMSSRLGKMIELFADLPEAISNTEQTGGAARLHPA